MGFLQKGVLARIKRSCTLEKKIKKIKNKNKNKKKAFNFTSPLPDSRKFELWLVRNRSEEVLVPILAIGESQSTMSLLLEDRNMYTQLTKERGEDLVSSA